MINDQHNKHDLQTAGRLYRYKRKVIVGVILVLSLSIAFTMIVIASELKTRLLDDSKIKTRELGQAIRLSFSNLMLVRNPDNIQRTLETIRSSESSIVRAFILNKKGKIAYSSDTGEIGIVLDRLKNPSCTGCHAGHDGVLQETTMIMNVNGRDVMRHVEIIHNEEPCHVCHPATDRINGKLIIDRSIGPTNALIARVQVMLAASGAFCLIFLVPFLSRVLSKGVDTYINEILLKTTELSLLYRTVERLSKTIDLEESRLTVIEIVKEILDADEIDVIFPKEGTEYGGIVWKRDNPEIERMMFPLEEPDRERVDAWAQGALRDIAVSERNHEVFLPIRKGDTSLALIVAKKRDGSLDTMGTNLLKAMGSHIAVALENAALYQIAITDSLTGLFTQRHFRNFMEKTFELFEKTGDKMALLMIDVDDFKKVNDTYGHPAGDQVLRTVGQSILSLTRSKDADFRYGGEEFAVVLLGADNPHGAYVAERIRRKIEGTLFAADGRSFQLTVSIGVSSRPENATAIRDVISAADKALYEAKRTGKNRVVVSKTVAGGNQEKA